MKNLVSIIIPYYNKLDWIDQTLRSIYNQTYTNYEILIVYDDPTKNDLKKLKLKIKNKKIKLYINKKNLGAGMSRNLASKKAKGKYLAFIDADDMWEKNKIKKQITFMKKKKIKISFTGYTIVNKQNSIIGKRSTKPILDYNNLLNSCDIGLSTVMIEKDLFKKYYFSKNRTKEDYSLWLRISKKYNIYGLNKNLTRWRKLNDSLSTNTTQKLFDAYDIYKNQEKFGYFRSSYRVFILSINFLLKYLNLKTCRYN
jgi:teichuronic acid biosynthesis glycosyltransferase TuaG